MTLETSIPTNKWLHFQTFDLLRILDQFSVTLTDGGNLQFDVLKRSFCLPFFPFRCHWIVPVEHQINCVLVAVKCTNIHHVLQPA